MDLYVVKLADGRRRLEDVLAGALEDLKAGGLEGFKAGVSEDRKAGRLAGFQAGVSTGLDMGLGTGPQVRLLGGPAQFRQAAEAGDLRGSRLLFAIGISESGINSQLMEVLAFLNLQPSSLEGAVGGIVIDGAGDWFTKDAGRRLAFAMNMAGCTLPGKPLVEATASLGNFDTIARTTHTTNRVAYETSVKILLEKILQYEGAAKQHPSILAVHASNRKTSNSLMLWSMVREHLTGLASIEEISIRNGQIWDCRGCKFEECYHFGENSSCFYGGVMVEKVYPAIIGCDVVVLICPNYNDSVSANIMAFINRLTAVFRTNDFSRKRVYALVVSGYSGGDIVAQQVIGAMNMNKNFILPGRFAMLETANDPGTVEKLPHIQERALRLAENILGKTWTEDSERNSAF